MKTDSEFILKKETNIDDIITHGNMFLLGNGHIGYRGTLEEYRKDQLTGLNIVGFYDQYEDKWRESINAPNPFYVNIKGHNVLTNKYDFSELELDLHHEVLNRKTIYNDLVITSHRTISSCRDNLLLMKYIITPHKKCNVDITFGLDTLIYDINGPHFKIMEVRYYDNLLHFHGITNEDKNLYMEIQYKLNGKEPVFNELDNLFHYEEEISEPLHLEVICKIYEYELNEKDRLEFKKLINEHTIYDLFEESARNFEKKWKVSDVIIDGDELAKFSIRYSIYHLLILDNINFDHSIPARGVSGQTYKGAIFWDTEIFLLPFFLITNPKIARKLLEYRIKTLSGALKKAEELGYKGAFYSWESQENGVERCLKYNVIDAITNEPIRTYFNEKQIHISADIVYAFNEYLRRTKDYSLLKDGGYEVIKQVFIFLNSYSILMNDGLYHFNDVIGPDEYHERVDDNAYTNYMNYESVKTFIEYYELVEEKKLFDVRDDYSIYCDAKEFLQKIFLPEINEDGLLEQFKGYFSLEDVDVDTIRSRLRCEKEYWGAKNGVATPTRVIKQADVIALMTLLPEKFNCDEIKKNYDFYINYTEHGSSLSPSMYSQCACRIGYLEDAYKMFIKTSTIDLGLTPTKMFAGGIYIGGTHPASNGGSYLSLINGFAGMTYKNNKYSFTPHLPKEIKSIIFSYYENDKLYKAFITNQEVKIQEVKDYD